MKPYMRLGFWIVAIITCPLLPAEAQQSGEETRLPVLKQTIEAKATPIEPALDRRNSEVYTRTPSTRDDQVFHLLDAGISAGQHEGGGKSVEVRRFGFNLDHGGVNGGLKVLGDLRPVAPQYRSWPLQSKRLSPSYVRFRHTAGPKDSISRRPASPKLEFPDLESSLSWRG